MREIIEYLQKYAPPRFIDRQKLTGCIRSVKQRHNWRSLEQCVDSLYEAWDEALKNAGVEQAKSSQPAKELDRLDSVAKLAIKLEALCLIEPLQTDPERAGFISINEPDADADDDA